MTKRSAPANFCKRRTHEDVWLPIGIAGLGLAGAIVPGFAVGATIVVVSIGAGAVLIWIALRVHRAIRWRREDREDVAAGAAWWAAQRELVGGDRR